MAFTVEKNNELFPAVAAGDATARTAMIEGNMGLVWVKADALIRTLPSIAYLRDDLISAGYVGLVRAINRVSSGRVRQYALNAWIGRCVTREMRRMLPHELSIHVPWESSRLARRNDQPIVTPIVTNALPETLPGHSALGVVDLRDIIAKCCQNAEERECLRLREEGYTHQEIADRLGLPLTTAYLMFRTVQDRILARLEDE
jgi:DNA-directed RNA polymerase specialized sigma24 family protein